MYPTTCIPERVNRITLTITKNGNSDLKREKVISKMIAKDMKIE